MGFKKKFNVFTKKPDIYYQSDETDPLWAIDKPSYSTKAQADLLYAPISVTQYTDELAQDAVGNAVGTGLDYDDGTGAISVDLTEVNHNDLDNKQGGVAGEYNHLTNAQVSALHNAVTVTDSTTIDFTLAGQDITASVKADSINDTHIDWGTGANQVSATDLPILDTADNFTATETESALAELFTGTKTFLKTPSSAPTTDYQVANKKYVDDSVSGENLWDRAGTVLSPHTAGDTVSSSGFTIGANTLDTNEWAFLDGQDQAVKTTSSPTFVGLNVTSPTNTFRDISWYEGATEVGRIRYFNSSSGSASDRIRFKVGESGDVVYITPAGTLGVEGNLVVNGGTVTLGVDTNFVLSGGVNGVSFGTDTLSIDATNDRVGIGTTAPPSTLSVWGGVFGGGAEILRFNGASTNGSYLILGHPYNSTKGSYDYLPNGFEVGKILGQAYNGTSMSTCAGIYLLADQTHASGKIGTRMEFRVTPNDSTAAPTTGLTLDSTGYIGLGLTAPTARLHFVSNTTAAGGILFGTDTNLYRSAADTLKTDDAFQAASYAVGTTAGASGTFTTADSKTVTVTNGIITSIA